MVLVEVAERAEIVNAERPGRFATLTKRVVHRANAPSYMRPEEMSSEGSMCRPSRWPVWRLVSRGYGVERAASNVLNETCLWRPRKASHRQGRRRCRRGQVFDCER